VKGDKKPLVDLLLFAAIAAAALVAICAPLAFSS